MPDQPSKYSYANNADLYLFYDSQEGGIKKLGFYASSGWVAIDNDLPSTQTSGQIECQFAGGYEAVWVVNSQGYVEQWWRYINSNWNLGKLVPLLCPTQGLTKLGQDWS